MNNQKNMAITHTNIKSLTMSPKRHTERNNTQMYCIVIHNGLSVSFRSRKTFFLSLGLSALAGYETSNQGDKLLPDGATLLDKDCFIYGGALTLELETYLTDRVVLLVNARERMLFGSDIGKFHTQVGMGLKFIIN